MLLLSTLDRSIDGAMRSGRGPLGDFGTEVRVARAVRPNADTAALARVFAPLPLPAWEGHDGVERLHGDGDTLMRIVGRWFVAITRSERAWRRLAVLAELEEPWFDPE